MSNVDITNIVAGSARVVCSFNDKHLLLINEQHFALVETEHFLSPSEASEVFTDYVGDFQGGSHGR